MSMNRYFQISVESVTGEPVNDAVLANKIKSDLDLLYGGWAGSLVDFGELEMDDASWIRCEEDMDHLSMSYPDLIFQVTCTGSTTDDTWIGAFCNGLHTYADVEWTPLDLDYLRTGKKSKDHCVHLTDDDLGLIYEALGNLQASREDELKWAVAGGDRDLIESDEKCLNDIDALLNKLNGCDAGGDQDPIESDEKCIDGTDALPDKPNGYGADAEQKVDPVIPSELRFLEFMNRGRYKIPGFLDDKGGLYKTISDDTIKQVVETAKRVTVPYEGYEPIERDIILYEMVEHPDSDFATLDVDVRNGDGSVEYVLTAHYHDIDSDGDVDIFTVAYEDRNRMEQSIRKIAADAINNSFDALVKLLKTELLCTSIDWCFDDEADAEPPALLTTVKVTIWELFEAGADIYSVDQNNLNSDDVLGEALVDFLSDKYGFLISGLSYEAESPDNADGE